MRQIPVDSLVKLPPWPVIRGAGIGGQKKAQASRGAATAPDTLNSTQYARLLLLLGEGEQMGWPSARGYTRGSKAYETALLKDIYINKTPILKASANPNNPKTTDFNFLGVVVDHRYGTVDQSSIKGFNATESQRGVGLPVTAATPLTRTITDSAVNALRITLSWQALQQYYDPKNKVSKSLTSSILKGGVKSPQEGDVIAVEVKYQIQVATAGGSFKTVVDTSVKGRSGDLFQRSHEVEIYGPFPVSVRVVRITPDSNNSKVNDTMVWSDYTELIYAKLRYPYSGLLALQLDAKYFSSWPQVSVDRLGVKIPIPDNATVEQSTGRLIYSGIWTGNFAEAQWTTDPAWHFFDQVTHLRYGFGHRCPPETVDKFALYSISKYCAELVSDGRGGFEPRFSFSHNIQSSDDAYKLINQMASVFRGMPHWGNGSVTVTQDAPGDAIVTVSNADISPEGFRYVGSSLRERHTVAVVRYFDNAKQDYDFVTVQDKKAIQLYGVKVANIDAFACTSPGQAHRAGQWLLYTEQYESEVVMFEGTVALGVELRPGLRFRAADRLKSGVRRAGKTIAGTTTSLTVDDATQTDLPTGADATITAKLVDGNLETRFIGSISGVVVTPALPFSAAPLIGGTWSIDNNAMRTSLWTAIGITESSRTKYMVSALRHNPSKYDYIERDIPLDLQVFAPLEIKPPAAPSSATAIAVVNPATRQTDMHLSWEAIPGAVEYEVAVRTV
jgi:predicted phage tail protein